LLPILLDKTLCDQAFSLVAGLLELHARLPRGAASAFLPPSSQAQRLGSRGKLLFFSVAHPHDELSIGHFASKIVATRSVRTQGGDWLTFEVTVYRDGRSRFRRDCISPLPHARETNQSAHASKLPKRAFLATDRQHQVQLFRLTRNPAFAGLLLGRS